MGDKPKLLFLDDRSKRLHAALKKYGDDYDVTLVCTSKECIEKLFCLEKWEVISLDYDLCYEQFVDPDRNDCGMEVVRWLVKYKETIDIMDLLPSQIKIHSSNAIGANLMYRTLMEAGYYPFVERFTYDD